MSVWCGAAHGQCGANIGLPVKVTRQPYFGGPTEYLSCSASGADITVTIDATLDWSGDWVVHVFDSTTTTAPSLSIGRVTISGDAPALTSLAVHVTAPTQPFDDNPDQGLLAGCVDFGGLIVSDAGTRAKTRCSVAVTGNLEHRGLNPSAPDIHVDQVIRVQADGAPLPNGQRSGGVIHANILADGSAFDTLGFNVRVIGHVRAYHGIVGNLRAARGAIDAVRVVGDPAHAPLGIQGDIIADGPQPVTSVFSIASVFTTGPIGTPSAVKKIWAAREIGQVIARAGEGQGETLLAASFHLDARAGLNAATTGNPHLDSACGRIATAGDITGVVQVPNFTTPSQGDSNRLPRGVYAGGDILAPVTVDFVCEGNILARRIKAPITVGYMMEGAIVGWERSNPDNSCPLISIGEAAPHPLYEASTPRGLVGFYSTTDCLLPIFQSATGNYDASALFNATQGCDEGGHATILATRRVEQLMIRAVTARELNENYYHRYAPLVEIKEIGSFTIGQMREGILWSGNGSAPYAVVEENSTVGCVSKWCDLDVELDSARLDVSGNLLGEIYLPSLAANSSIRVGGALGSEGNQTTPSQLCTCVDPGSDCGTTNPWSQPPTNLTPTNRNAVAAARGRIVLQDAASLRDRVVLNASNLSTAGGANPPSALWAGVVRVDGTAELALDSATPYQGPYYTSASGPLGGMLGCAGTSTQQFLAAGAVGLVPFHFYEGDARFIDLDSVCGSTPFYPATIEQAQFCQYTLDASGNPTNVHQVGVQIPFYGRVLTELAPPANPFKVEWHALTEGVNCQTATGWIDMSVKVGASIKRAADPTSLPGRTATLLGLRVNSPTRFLPPGLYRVSIAAPGNVKCDGLAGMTPTPPDVPNFSYCFVLSPTPHEEPDGEGGCIADFDDGSGTGTPDGGVTIDDLIFFLGAFEAGDLICDVDNGFGGGETDGGVTIDDLIFFLWHFNAGC